MRDARRRQGSRYGQGSQRRQVALPDLPYSRIIALLAILVLVFALTRCVGAFLNRGSDNAAQTGGGSNQGSTEQTLVSSPDGATPDEASLKALIGDEKANKLLERAKTDPDAYWVASHVDKYAFDGDSVQVKTLKLAADEPAAIRFVRAFPEDYPADAENADPSIAIDDSQLKGTRFDTKVPHYYQWDPRWAQTVYSSTAFGLTGCGPTCMSMVYQGLTGATDKDPYVMSVIAQQGGYMDQYHGTAHAFYVDTADAFGLRCESISVSANNIVSYLQSGHVIIANLVPGHFTTVGHYFVLVGVDSDGKIIINDPYSQVRSMQTWDADLIASESRALYAYSRS